MNTNLPSLAVLIKGPNRYTVLDLVSVTIFLTVHMTLLLEVKTCIAGMGTMNIFLQFTIHILA